MRKLRWCIAVHYSTGVQPEDFAGTIEECRDRVIVRAIETEKRVTADSEDTDVIIDSYSLDF